MNYLAKRYAEEKCPFCKEEFLVSKHINEEIKFLGRRFSFWKFSCAGSDHVLNDYVSLYQTPTFYRRITCTIDLAVEPGSRDILQVHLDFIKQKSIITVELSGRTQSTPIEFNYILEDCNNIDKLMKRLEVYQTFS